MNGDPVYKVLPRIHVYMVLRAAIGLLIVSGAVCGLYNVIRTIRPADTGEEGS